MYRTSPKSPALERDPKRLVEELGVLEPGEPFEVGPVQRVRTTAARVRVAYAIAREPVGQQDEVIVDAPGVPAFVASRLGRSQCVAEHELLESELRSLPRAIRKLLRAHLTGWRKLGGGTAEAKAAHVRVEDVLRVDVTGRAGKSRAWIGTSPLRLLGVQRPTVAAAVIARASVLAGLPTALAYLALSTLLLALGVLLVGASH